MAVLFLAYQSVYAVHCHSTTDDVDKSNDHTLRLLQSYDSLVCEFESCVQDLIL